MSDVNRSRAEGPVRFSPHHQKPPSMVDRPPVSVLLPTTRWTDACGELAAQLRDLTKERTETIRPGQIHGFGCE